MPYRTIAYCIYCGEELEVSAIEVLTQNVIFKTHHCRKTRWKVNYKCTVDGFVLEPRRLVNHYLLRRNIDDE